MDRKIQDSCSVGLLTGMSQPHKGFAVIRYHNPAALAKTLATIDSSVHLKKMHGTSTALNTHKFGDSHGFIGQYSDSWVIEDDTFHSSTHIHENKNPTCQSKKKTCMTLLQL